MKTNMTPLDESARLEKFTRDLNSAIWKLSAELAIDCGKSPAEIIEINSVIADAGVFACVEALDNIA